MQSILDLKTSANPRRITLGMRSTGLPLIEKNDIATVAVNTNDKVVIVDTIGELGPFVNTIGGVSINVCNILGYANEIIFEKCCSKYEEDYYETNLFVFFESLGNLLRDGGLTPVQKGILDKCIVTMIREKKECNIKMFLSILKELDEELFVLYGILDSKYFSYRDENAYNNIDNRIVSFVLNSNSHLSAIEFLFVLKIVRNQEYKTYTNWSSRLWFFSKVDGNLELEKESYYFSLVYKISRKYGAIVMLYSNEFEFFTKGEYSKSILCCTGDFLIGKQSKYDANLLCDVFSLKNEQESLLDTITDKESKEWVWTNGIEYEKVDVSFLQNIIGY